MKRIDASSLLRLRSPAAWGFLALIVGTQVLFAVAGLPGYKSPWPVAAALVVFTAGALLMARPHADPYPARWTAGVLAAGVATNALVLWSLPDAGWPGYGAWNFGAVTWLLFFLAFRGRAGSAWLGLLAMALLTLAWTASVGRPPLEAVDLVIRHAGTLLMGTLFSLLLTRVSTRITAIQEESVAQAAAEAASFAELRERELQAQQLSAEARPVLERLAAGEIVDAPRQREYALLEAALRDTLRGSGLLSPAVAAAASAARDRGAEVVLLDDRNDSLPDALAERLQALVVSELARLNDGRITVRLLPAGRTAVATLVRSDTAGRRRVDFADG